MAGSSGFVGFGFTVSPAEPPSYIASGTVFFPGVAPAVLAGFSVLSLFASVLSAGFSSFFTSVEAAGFFCSDSLIQAIVYGNLSGVGRFST